MKNIFKSKTIWINVIVLLTTWFLNHKGVMAAAGLDADAQVTILAIVNFINRFFTKEAVTVS